MSLGSHFKNRQSVLALETEASAGTAETLVEGDVHCLVGDVDVSVDFEQIENELSRATLSTEPDFSGIEQIDFSFFNYLKGQGAAGEVPDWGELLIHAGFTQTIDAGVDVRYSPDSNFTTNPATMGLMFARSSSGNALLYTGKGCRAASMRLILEPGRVPRVEWTWRGAFAAIADATLLSTVANYHDGAGLDGTQPARLTDFTLAIGAWNPNFTRLEILIEWELVPIEDSSDTSGLCGYEVVGRATTGTLTLRARPVSEKDIVADLRAAATAALSGTIGGTAGNIVQISAPRVSFSNLVPGEDSGLRTNEIGLKFNGNAGDDEILFIVR